MKKIERLFVKNFWLALFLVTAFFLYESESSKLNDEIRVFGKQLQSIDEETAFNQKKKQLLEAKIASLEDPSTIEDALIRRLGMVPSGYVKLVISEQKETGR